MKTSSAMPSTTAGTTNSRLNGTPPNPEPGAAPGSGFGGVPFNRLFVVPAVVLGIAELVFIAYPLGTAFDLAGFGGDTLLRTALPVAVGAIVVWLAAITAWLLPLWSAVAASQT